MALYIFGGIPSVSLTGSLYQDIEITGWDVAVVYDYSDLSVDLSFLEGYNTVWLFAWSLGVRMAAASLPPEKITAAFAINGTLSPVSDTEGIPPKIYNATADNLDEMSYVSEALLNFFAISPQSGITDLTISASGR